MVIKPKRRIAIYVYHNVLNKVSNYALYYLSSLKEITDEIIVVLNGKFDEKEKEKLYNLNLAVLERENKGYTLIKIAEPNVWIEKHRYIYEKKTRKDTRWT